MNISLEYYKSRLQMKGSKFTLIDSNESMVSMVYKIVSPNGSRFVLKICPREEDYKRENFFLNFLEEKIPVPRVFKLIEPSENHPAALLLEDLGSSAANEASLNQQNLYKIGEALAKIHSVTQESYGDLTKIESLSKDPKVPFALKFREGLEECKNHLSKDMLDFLESYLNQNLYRLEKSDGPCLIHRDFRPANIILNKKKLKGIIDWSSARSSFSEEDFCALELGEWPINELQKKSFLEGYASIRQIPEYQTIMPLLLAHRALAVVGFTVKKNTFSTVNSEPYQRNLDFLENFIKKEVMKR